MTFIANLATNYPLDKFFGKWENISTLSELIGKLKYMQVQEGLTDKEMAIRLGCSRQLYQMTRTGKVPPGNKIIKGISTSFPELQQDVIYFLSNNDNRMSDNANNPLKCTSEPQGRGLKGFLVGLLGRIRK